MKLVKTITIVLILACLIFVSRYVWLPDVFSGNSKTITVRTNEFGHSFRVIQKWGGDFYCTTLKHQLPNKEWRAVVLDPDGVKLWSCSIEFNQTNNTVRVVGRGSTLGWYDWNKNELTRLNGVKVQALLEKEDD